MCVCVCIMYGTNHTDALLLQSNKLSMLKLNVLFTIISQPHFFPTIFLDLVTFIEITITNNHTSFVSTFRQSIQTILTNNK